MGRPFAWDNKRSPGLVDQLGAGFEFDFINHEDLGNDEPGCETNHQCAQRESFKLAYFHGSQHVRWNTVLLSRVREISAVPFAGLCVIHCSELGFAADVNKEPSFISVLAGTLLDSSIPQASEDRYFRKFEIFLPMPWTQ